MARNALDGGDSRIHDYDALNYRARNRVAAPHAASAATAISAPHLTGVWNTVAVVGAVCCAGYVAFMVFVDVPMYVRRWRDGRASGAPRLGLRDGWRDALGRRVVTRDWATWRPEVAWLTGYFTGAVWLSLLIVHLPR